jgi:hypothetical protein
MLCERTADNPTLPMKEVYNQFMSSDAPLLEDDLLEPQLRSCKSQMYRACRRQNMPPLPAIREDINFKRIYGGLVLQTTMISVKMNEAKK